MERKGARSKRERCGDERREIDSQDDCEMCKERKARETTWEESWGLGDHERVKQRQRTKTDCQVFSLGYQQGVMVSVTEMGIQKE